MALPPPPPSRPSSDDNNAPTLIEPTPMAPTMVAAPSSAAGGSSSSLDADGVVVEMAPYKGPAPPTAASSSSSCTAPATSYATTLAAASSSGGSGVTAEDPAAAGPFPYWRKPGRWSGALTAATDLGTWAALLGVGIAMDDYGTGGVIAAAVSVAGLALRTYRYRREKSLRIFPKAHPTLLSAAWIVNGLFCAGVSRATANRYSLFLVISGVVAASVVSLALGRPLVLEQALEHVTSREEERHPIFQRSCRRLSVGLLVVNLLQWPCFFAAAVFLYDAKELIVLTLVAVLPLSLLLIYVVLAVVYGFVEGTLLEEALRKGVDSSEGMDVTAVVLAKVRSSFRRGGARRDAPEEANEAAYGGGVGEP